MTADPHPPDPNEIQEEFSRLVRETPSGRDVRLTVARGGATQSVTVKVGSRRAGILEGNLAPLQGFKIQIPDVPSGRMSWRNSVLGVEAEAIEGQLAEYFGAKEGVLVRSVNRASAAEKAGIKAGDVITSVAGNRVTSSSELSSRLRSSRGSSVSISLLREHKEMTVTVMLDDDRALRQNRVAAKEERF